MARVKLRCIMGCPGLKSSYWEKGLLSKWFILLHGLKFSPTLKRTVVTLKLYQACKLLADFFQNKEANHSEENLFFKKNLLLPNLETDIDLDHQIDVVINLKLKEMEKKNFQN